MAYFTTEYGDKVKYTKYKYPWHGTDWKEISSYFGLNYLFGLVNKSNYCEHWTNNPLVFYPFP